MRGAERCVLGIVVAHLVDIELDLGVTTRIDLDGDLRRRGAV